MTRKVLLIVIGILLIISVAVIGDMRMWCQEKIPDAANLREYADSILDWETVVSVVPKVADYKVHEDTAIRVGPGHVIITSDSPLLWLSSREVSENGPDVPGGFRCFAVFIAVF